MKQKPRWHHDADFFLGVREYDHINIGFGDDEHIEWHFHIDWDGTEDGVNKLVQNAKEVVAALNSFYTTPIDREHKSLAARLRAVALRLDELEVGADIADDLDRITNEIRKRGLDEVDEFDKFCDSLDQETLDEMVHEAKSEEASAINNDGKGAQVNYLLGNGFTRETLRAQCAAKDAADEAGRSGDEVELFADRVVRDTDEGIRMFGEYTFSDKGADGVVDVDQFADELRKMSPESAGEYLEALAKRGKAYKKVADAILGQLDDTDEDWWEKCRENCPTVEY